MLYASSILFSTAALFSVVHLAPISNTGVAVAGAYVAGATCLFFCGGDNNNNSPQPSTDTSQASSNTSPAVYGDANPAQLTCSSTPGGGAPKANVSPASDNPAWVNSMRNCLYKLDGDWVDNYNCQPNNGNGTIIGPATFGFQSKGVKWEDPKDCFHKCSPCLALGIQNHEGIDTSCSYDAGGGASCEMSYISGK